VKISPPQQSTLMSTMVGPDQKPHRPSWGQAIHLPILATILLKPCWSGIVKKQKEKISFWIRKWPTSWHNRNQGKKHIENLLFLTKQPFQRPQSTTYAFICSSLWKRKRMAKKELFLIELVMFLLKKTTAWKTSKNDNQTYIRTQKTVCSHCQTWKNFLQPAITIIKERRKKFVREMINFFNFLSCLPSSWWIVVCHRC